MSDTPRTDAEEWDADLDMVVDSDFARTLERELAEARKALVWVWDDWQDSENDTPESVRAAVCAAREAKG